MLQPALVVVTATTKVPAANLRTVSPTSAARHRSRWRAPAPAPSSPRPSAPSTSRTIPSAPRSASPLARRPGSRARNGAAGTDGLELDRAEVARRGRAVRAARERHAAARRVDRARSARARRALLAGGRGLHARGSSARTGRRRGIELRLLGRWPLLRFGAPQTLVDASGVLCRFPITGGLLARSPGGSITFAQVVAPAIELRATIDGFYPRLSARLYRHVQQRIHTSISRRYFGG